MIYSATTLSSYWHTYHWIVIALIIVAIWELIWRSIALWRAAQAKQLTWFIALFVLNTAGILPIVYLVAFQKPRK